MKSSPYRVLSVKKRIANPNGNISARESVPIPQNIHDNNSSSTSIKYVPNLPDISLSPNDKKKKSKNKSVDRSSISDEPSSLRKLESLPKINNPKAENRLKSLIQLLDKKNPALLKAKDSSSQAKSPKTDRNISLDGIEKERSSCVPSLPSLSTRPSDREENDSVKKIVVKSPKKIIFKVVNDVENVEPPQSKKPSPKYLAPIHNSKAQKSENRREVSVEIRKKKANNIFAVNKSEESSLEKGYVNNNMKKEPVNKKREIPEPEVDFEYRVHKSSIEDALERLNQLTNQSKNARKDLFKIQENALAIRLSYERNHRGINKINSEMDARVH